MEINTENDTLCKYELVYRDISNINRTKNFVIDINEFTYRFKNLKAATAYRIEIKEQAVIPPYSSAENIKRKRHEGDKFNVNTLPPKIEKVDFINKIDETNDTHVNKTHTAIINWTKPDTTEVGEIYYSVKYTRKARDGDNEIIVVTTNKTTIPLKDLAADSSYSVEVRMKTDFTYFALFGEGLYSTPIDFTTLPIVSTFLNHLQDKLGVNALNNDIDSK